MNPLPGAWGVNDAIHNNTKLANNSSGSSSNIIHNNNSSSNNMNNGEGVVNTSEFPSLSEAMSGNSSTNTASMGGVGYAAAMRQSQSVRGQSQQSSVKKPSSGSSNNWS